jgi:hypothetical protein
MFNLIVAVISIALIAAMAAASIFYGGESFSASSARAEAATLINQALQIDGAADLFKTNNLGSMVVSDQPSCDGGTLSDCALPRLVDQGYLSAIPRAPADLLFPGTSWSISDDGSAAFMIFTTDAGVADKICEEIEAQGGGVKLPGLMGNVPGDAWTVEKFGLDLIEEPFRCADTDVGGGLILTAFGYRL